MAQVQGVAGAGIVDIEAFVIGHQAVVGRIVDAAHGQGRALFVALGGVVVDHVEDHLQIGFVQVRDHFLEFGNLATGQVPRVGGEERNAVVAPIVGHALVQQMLVVDERMDRQQLHGRHTEFADVLDHFIDHQPGKGAAQIFGDGRVTHAEAAHMGFIDDRPVPRHADTMIVAPGVRRVDDLAFGHEGRAVPFIEAEVGVGVADGVAEQRFGPFQLAHQLFGVGVDQQFVGVEAMAVGRVVGAVDAIAVDQPRMGVGQVAVVDLVGVLGQFDAFEFHLAGVVEQAQFNLGGVGGKQSEVDSQSIPGGTQRKGQAFADSCGFGTRGWRGGFLRTGHRYSCKRGLPVGASLLRAALRRKRCVRQHQCWK
ncbi:hypothetical protein D3C72_1008100 [compost metagenome]